MSHYREEINVMDEEAGVVGDPEDESITEVAGVAPPCGACGRREAVEAVGDLDLCGECLDRVDDELRALLAFVSWLPPTARGDLVATEVAGETRADRAREREVAPAVVSANVTRAIERLETIADERGEA